MSTVIAVIIIGALVVLVAAAFCRGLIRLYIPDDDLEQALWKASQEYERRPRLPAPGGLR